MAPRLGLGWPGRVPSVGPAPAARVLSGGFPGASSNPMGGIAASVFTASIFLFATLRFYARLFAVEAPQSVGREEIVGNGHVRKPAP